MDRFVSIPPRVASSIWQSNGLLIRRFWVQVPGDPPRAPVRRGLRCFNTISTRIVPHAGVAELADAPGLGPELSRPMPCHSATRSQGPQCFRLLTCPRRDNLYQPIPASWVAVWLQSQRSQPVKSAGGEPPILPDMRWWTADSGCSL